MCCDSSVLSDRRAAQSELLISTFARSFCFSKTCAAKRSCFSNSATAFRSPGARGASVFARAACNSRVRRNTRSLQLGSWSSNNRSLHTPAKDMSW